MNDCSARFPSAGLVPADRSSAPLRCWTSFSKGITAVQTALTYASAPTVEAAAGAVAPVVALAGELELLWLEEPPQPMIEKLNSKAASTPSVFREPSIIKTLSERSAGAKEFLSARQAASLVAAARSWGSRSGATPAICESVCLIWMLTPDAPAW